jgi:hypothetical protein
LDLSRFLRIAINLATALGRTHQGGLIHRAAERPAMAA